MADQSSMHYLYLDGTDPRHPLPAALKWILIGLAGFWILLGIFSNPRDWNINVNLLLGIALLLFVFIFTYASKPAYLGFDESGLMLRLDRKDPVNYPWDDIETIQETDRTLIIEFKTGSSLRLDLKKLPSRQLETELPVLLELAE